MQNVLVGQDVSEIQLLTGPESLGVVGADQVLPFHRTSSGWPELKSHAMQSVAVRQPRAVRVPLPPPTTCFHGPHVTASAAVFAAAGLAAAAFAATDVTEADVAVADATDVPATADSAAAMAHASPNPNTLRRLTKAP
jgi:hypothetical protein